MHVATTIQRRATASSRGERRGGDDARTRSAPWPCHPNPDRDRGEARELGAREAGEQHGAGIGAQREEHEPPEAIAAEEDREGYAVAYASTQQNADDDEHDDPERRGVE